jgi:type VI secretion system secreted protein Hcp
MAVDCFIEFKGGDWKIEGESLDNQHPDKSEVLSWSWGCSNSGNLHEGTGATTGKANFQDMSIMMQMTKSTNAIMKSCATGDHKDEVTIYQRRAGGDKPQDYCKWTLKTVLISSVSTGGPAGDGPLMLNLTLHYKEMKFEYFPQKTKGGKAEAPKPFGYDIPANKATA